MNAPYILPLAALPFAMQPGPAMWALIAGEVGGFLVLFAGALKALPLTIPL